MTDSHISVVVRKRVHKTLGTGTPYRVDMTARRNAVHQYNISPAGRGIPSPAWRHRRVRRAVQKIKIPFATGNQPNLGRQREVVGVTTITTLLGKIIQK